MAVHVLFVCTGNICRSPSAEGVFRAKAAAAGLSDRVTVDSVGMHAYHVGEPPDERSCRVALQRGYDLRDLRARRIAPRDYEESDLILAMDRGHIRELRQAAPASAMGKISLFLSFWPHAPVQDVPDPYYGDLGGFISTFELIDKGADALLAHLARTVGAQ